MLRVVMFDLDGTLLDARQHPWPHVPAALRAIMALRASNGRPLACCLVSDFTPVPPPITAAKVKPLFEAYLAILQAAGLRALFEPVARRVTLSTHVGVSKPGRAIFERALQRLRSNAPLAECLLVTENAAHVAAVRRELGMQALQFKAPESARNDFDDWSQAPALVAHLVDPQHAGNLAAAAGVYLAARGVELESIEPAAKAGQWQVTGSHWHPVRLPGHEDLGTLHLSVPVQGVLHRERSGALRAELPAPDPSHLEEAASFAASLAANGQIATATRDAKRGRPAAAGAARANATTHAIETDAEGRRRLVRKRFSAF